MKDFSSWIVWIVPLLIEKNGGIELHEKIQTRCYPACIIASSDGDGTDGECVSGKQLRAGVQRYEYNADCDKFSS